MRVLIRIPIRIPILIRIPIPIIRILTLRPSPSTADGQTHYNSATG